MDLKRRINLNTNFHPGELPPSIFAVREQEQLVYACFGKIGAGDCGKCFDYV
jgi:hypothetical protein